MNKNLNKKIILICILFLVALSFCIYFFLLIKERNKHASMVEADIATSGVRLLNLEKTKKSVADSATTRGEIDAYFVNQAGIADFLSSLESMGPLSGASVAIASVEINDKSIADQTDKSAKTLKVSIHVIGDFNQVYNLEKLIENAPYDLDILRSFMVRSDITDSKGKTQTSWNLDMDLELKSFIPN